MKFRKLIIPIFITVLCSSASAQYNTLNEWYIGPSIGATMSTISLVPTYVKNLYTIRKSGGISTRYISENHFGFQIDLDYFESGWKEQEQSSAGASEAFSYTRNLNFIEVPFLMHMYTTAQSTRFFLNLGPKFSYLLSENEKFVDNSTSSTYTYLEHGKLVERPFQYGLLGGVGLEVHLKRSVLGIEGRYCYSLSNLFSDAVDDDFNTSSLQTVSLNLYYYFQVGGRK